MNSDRTLSLSTVTHIINAPLEQVDISDWLFNLSDAEYQRCSHLHAYIGASITTSDDGRPMKSTSRQSVKPSCILNAIATCTGDLPSENN